MANITISVCDVCKDSTKPVETYRVIRSRTSRKFDLCEAHARFLEELWNLKSPRRLQMSVTTLEEIEERKQRQTR